MKRIGFILASCSLCFVPAAYPDDGVKVEVIGRAFVRQGRADEYEIVAGKRVYVLVTPTLETRKPLADLMLSAAWRDRSAFDAAKVTVKGTLDDSNAIVVESVTVTGAPASVAAKATAPSQPPAPMLDKLAGKLRIEEDGELVVTKGDKQWRLGFPSGAAGKTMADVLRKSDGRDVALTGMFRTVDGEEVFLVAAPQKR